jgi:SAM-dependent methyltransferase
VLVNLLLPPIIIKLYKTIMLRKTKLLSLLDQFERLPRAQHGLYKLVNDYKFDTVLDVGAGFGEHSQVLHDSGKTVWALDFGTSVYANTNFESSDAIDKIYANFYDVKFDRQFDCIWASHVLEHQPDPGLFIRKCAELTKIGGVIAITVPPLKHEIVGGHLTLWNAGLLLYQLAFNGIDCRDASILSHEYNITVIVRNVKRKQVPLTYDNGDIDLLKEFLPEFIVEPFDGRIERYNW